MCATSILLLFAVVAADPSAPTLTITASKVTVFSGEPVRLFCVIENPVGGKPFFVPVDIRERWRYSVECPDGHRFVRMSSGAYSSEELVWREGRVPHVGLRPGERLYWSFPVLACRVTYRPRPLKGEVAEPSFFRGGKYTLIASIELSQGNVLVSPAITVVSERPTGRDDQWFLKLLDERPELAMSIVSDQALLNDTDAVFVSTQAESAQTSVYSQYVRFCELRRLFTWNGGYSRHFKFHSVPQIGGLIKQLDGLATPGFIYGDEASAIRLKVLTDIAATEDAAREQERLDTVFRRWPRVHGVIPLKDRRLDLLLEK